MVKYNSFLVIAFASFFSLFLCPSVDQEYQGKIPHITSEGPVPRVFNCLYEDLVAALEAGESIKPMLFYGPEGSGKTYLAHLLAHKLQIPLYTISVPEFYPFDSPVNKSALLDRCAEIAHRETSVVVLLDDVDCCIAHQLEQTPIVSLIHYINKHTRSQMPIIMLVAARLPKLLDSGFHFGHVLFCELPSVNDRQYLIELLLKAKGRTSTPEQSLRWAHDTAGLTPGEIESVIIRTCQQAKDMALSLEEIFKQKLSSFMLLKYNKELGTQVNAHSVSDVHALVTPVNPTSSLKDLAGTIPQDIYQFIAAINNPQGLPPRGLLLYGPPGTGKTSLARAIAGHVKAYFFAINASSLVDPYIGSGANKICSLFNTARSLTKTGIYDRAVIFIDELDCICNTKLRKDIAEYTNTMKELMVQLDGYHENNSIFVIAATNNYEHLDKALVRSCRFDALVKIDLPDGKSRAAIMEHLLKKSNLQCTTIPLYAEQSLHSFSHADLVNFFKRICRQYAQGLPAQLSVDRLFSIAKSMCEEFGKPIPPSPEPEKCPCIRRIMKKTPKRATGVTKRKK